MKPISAKVIGATIEVLATDGISEGEIEARIGGFVSDPMEARRLIDWIPEVFGLVALSHLGNPVLPRTFSARNAQGEWNEFPFSCEPLFAVSLQIAQTMYHDGPRAHFQNIASRSAMVNSANSALNAGVSIDGAVFSGPALIGIPAEVYPKQNENSWSRLGRTLAKWWCRSPNKSR